MNLIQDWLEEEYQVLFVHHREKQLRAVASEIFTALAAEGLTAEGVPCLMSPGILPACFNRLLPQLKAAFWNHCVAPGEN